MDAFFDVTPKITLRGGYRYVWGNASDVILPIAELAGLEAGKIRRSVWIAGLAWRPFQNAWVNLDFEDGSSGSTYFRTSLYNYQKVQRARPTSDFARVQRIGERHGAEQSKPIARNPLRFSGA